MKKLTKNEFIDKYLKEGVGFQTRMRDRLFSFGIKQNRCEICGLTEWQGKPLVIQVHHINGNRNDNRLENLQMLCPNCHSQTENYQSKNTYTYNGKDQICLNCGKQFKSKYGDHKFCSNKCCREYGIRNQRLKLSPYSKEYLKELCDNYNTLNDIGFVIHRTKDTVKRILIQENLFEYYKQKRSLRNKPILQYSADGTFLKEWPSVMDAQKTLNIGHISLVCNGTRLSSGGYIWRYKDSNVPPQKLDVITKRDDRIREVLQYTKEGQFVREFKSIHDAARITGINHICIQNCLSGRNTYAKNYIWKYKDGEIPQTIEIPTFHNNEPKVILQCDLQGNVLNEHQSMYSAGKSNKLSIESIRKCLLGIRPSYHGYIWKFK